MREALMLLETELLCPGTVCEQAPAQSGAASKGTAKVGKGNGAGMVYTIGFNGFTSESMVEVFRALNVNVLVDCCWKPNRALRAVLNDQYEWAGDRLSAGRTSDTVREKGYAWLLSQVTAGKSVLMTYREEEPWRCRRHSEIAIALLDRGVEVTHVHNDQLILASELQAALDEEREYKFKKWRLPKAV
jgi:hypothetical protein